MPEVVKSRSYSNLELNLNDFLGKEIWNTIYSDKKKLFILSSRQCPFCSEAIDMILEREHPDDLEFIRLEHDYNAKSIQKTDENTIEINNLFMDKFPFKDFPSFILTSRHGKLIDVTSSPIKVLNNFYN